MTKVFSTIFVGGGVGNTFAVSEMVKNLVEVAQKKSIVFPKQRLILIDRMGYFGGGIPWGKASHPSYFFNNPHRLTEPQEVFKKWIFKNLDQVITYIKHKGGKVGLEWLERNQKSLYSRQIDEVYFPRRIYGFFMEDKLYQTLQVAENAEKQNILDIEIQLIESTVEQIRQNSNGTKQIYLKNNQGYQVAMIPNSNSSSFPQFLFNRTRKISKVSDADNICISIGILPNPNLNSNSKHPNYIATLYENNKINDLKRQILQIYQQHQRKVSIVFLGSSSTFLDPLLELESDSNIASIIKIISISKQGKTRQPAIFTSDLPVYKPQFINKSFSKVSDLILALEKEYKFGQEKGYHLYDIWRSSITSFQENLIFLKDSYPEEFNKYLKTEFIKVRKLTNFTNPDTIAAKERLEKNNILSLQEADFKKYFNLEERDNQFTIALRSPNNSLKTIVADILVNAMGEDSLKNLIQYSSLIQSLMNCGVQINESQNGFKTDANQKASEGVYIIGKLAFGSNSSNFESALRYTHLKSTVSEGLKVGKALSLASINSTKSVVYPAY